MSHTKETQYVQERRRYLLGFGAALLLTYASYALVVYDILSGAMLAAVLLVFAAVQLIVQLRVFLHAGDEAKPRFTLWSMLYVGAMLLIIVVASLWIMANMNYNMMMTPEQMQQFMLEQNKKGF